MRCEVRGERCEVLLLFFVHMGSSNCFFAVHSVSIAKKTHAAHVARPRTTTSLSAASAIVLQESSCRKLSWSCLCPRREERGVLRSEVWVEV